MKRGTRERIDFLQNYMYLHYQDWYALHSKNITGFYVGRKIKKGKPTGPYGFVFTVAKKLDIEKLKKSQIIPPYYEVTFPNGEVKRVKTDVQMTGRPKLHINQCTQVLSNGKLEVGTIGVYVRDANLSIYGVTNYHVAAWERMLNNEFSFQGSDRSIYIENTQAEFTWGIFSTDIDAAFIRVPNGVGVSNVMANGVIIKSIAPGPFPTSVIGQQVAVYCLDSPNVRNAFVQDNNSIFVTGFKDLKLEHVLRLNRPVTSRGNSGSPVLLGNNLLGIVTGGDDWFTYVIPFYKIAAYHLINLI